VIELLYELVPTFRPANAGIARQLRQRLASKEGPEVLRPLRHQV
jgi:hypothetical protein